MISRQDVPYHRQVEATNCGAACLQMVVEALNGKTGSQDDLYNETRQQPLAEHVKDWFSPPSGVAKVLEERGALRSGAVVVAFDGKGAEEDLTRRLVWSLVDAKVPPIALVLLQPLGPLGSSGADHWVVIVGCGTDAVPKGAADTTYKIHWLEIHNPWRYQSDLCPPPPPPPQHMTFVTWRRRYLSSAVPNPYAGKVVAVVGS